MAAVGSSMLQQQATDCLGCGHVWRLMYVRWMPLLFETDKAIPDATCEAKWQLS